MFDQRLVNVSRSRKQQKQDSMLSTARGKDNKSSNFRFRLP